MAYIDLATLKSSLGITDSDRDGLLTGSLAAASAAIDERCGRSFAMSESPSARVFRTRGRTVAQADGELLLVDDIADASVTVEVPYSDEWAAIGTSLYELEPLNALDLGKPVTGISISSWRTCQKVRITATWGWPAVPEQIKQATLIQATRLYRRKDSPEGVAGSADWGLIRMPHLDPDVRALVEPFRLPSFGGC